MIGKAAKPTTTSSQNASRLALERANTQALLSKAVKEIKESRQFTSLATAVKDESERRHALQHTLDR